jgi:hypothetical protein
LDRWLVADVPLQGRVPKRYKKRGHNHAS